MRNTRVLLSVREQLNAQLLRYFFSSNEGFELLGEAHDVLDILSMVQSRKPDLWIHSWNQSGDLEGILSHVYTCHPDLAIVRISPDEITGFAQQPIHSVSDLLEFAHCSRITKATASV